MGKIVLAHNVLARKGPKQLAEDHQHSWRACPARHHTIRHLIRTITYILWLKQSTFYFNKLFTFVRQNADAQRTL